MGSEMCIRDSNTTMSRHSEGGGRGGVEGTDILLVTLRQVGGQLGG